MLSYVDDAVNVAQADDYASKRGHDVFVNSESTKKQAALRRGQDYIASQYNDRWSKSFTDSDAPDVVIFAIVEAAVRELTAPNSLMPDYTAGKVLKRERVKAGPVESEEEYRDDGVTPPRLVVGVIDRLLAGVLKPAKSGNIGLWAVG